MASGVFRAVDAIHVAGTRRIRGYFTTGVHLVALYAHCVHRDVTGSLPEGFDSHMLSSFGTFCQWVGAVGVTQGHRPINSADARLFRMFALRWAGMPRFLGLSSYVEDYTFLYQNLPRLFALASCTQRKYRPCHPTYWTGEFGRAGWQQEPIMRGTPLERLLTYQRDRRASPVMRTLDPLSGLLRESPLLGLINHVVPDLPAANLMPPVQLTPELRRLVTQGHELVEEDNPSLEAPAAAIERRVRQRVVAPADQE